MIKRLQRGMSLIGFLLVLSLVIFFAYLAMRIVPIYIEYYTVAQAMQGIERDYKTVGIPQHDIRRQMIDRLYISQTATNVKPEHIKLVRSNGLILRVRYEVRKPLLGNLDVIASFDKSVTLTNT